MKIMGPITEGIAAAGKRLRAPDTFSRFDQTVNDAEIVHSVDENSADKDPVPVKAEPAVNVPVFLADDKAFTHFL